MMARALVSILPPLSRDEALEVTRIFSVAGLLPRHTPLIRARPFCAPHHTTSLAGLVGGGAGRIRPGMLSLAHRGVLFLDELPEFGSRLEVLRQPLEDRSITLSRASGSVTFPASIMLVAAQNPCPCGWHGDTMRRCQCSTAAVQRYQARISGPLLDRIDLHVAVPRVEHERLVLRRPAEASQTVRARVCEARERQRARWGDATITCNADMGPAELRDSGVPDDAAQRLLDAALRQLGLSARGYYRVLKLARTIADLAGVSQIGVMHVGEALQYRPTARQRDAV
jgi:magnesium chelatase family protein